MNYIWDFLSTDAYQLSTFVVLTAVKASLLLTFAWLLCVIFRRFSAATRHLLWTCALCASLALPFLSFIQGWEVPILPASVLTMSSNRSNENFNDNEEFQVSEALAAENFTVSLAINSLPQKKSEFQTETDYIKKSSPIPAAIETQIISKKDAQMVLPSLINFVSFLWIAGVFLFLFRLFIGLTATGLIIRRAGKFGDSAINELFSNLRKELNLENSIRLLCVEQASMPVACGILRPVVLLPADAENWSEERQRMVLLHELAHIARRDCLTQMLAQIACAFYWFNPFVWYAARRLRIEREQACDNYVLNIGTKPSDYAGHLLEIARSMQEQRSIFEWSQTNSVAIARCSQLEGRLRAILSQENKSGAVSRLIILGVVSSIFVLLFALAAFRPTPARAQSPQTSENELIPEISEIKKPTNDDFLQNESEPLEKEISEIQKPSLIEKQVEKISEHESSKEHSKILAQTKTGGKSESSNDVVQNFVEQTKTVENQVVNRQIQPEINPFVKTDYKREPEPESPHQSGDYIDEMASVGYANLSVDDLIKLKQSNISADYVKNLRSLGLVNLTVKELASMGIHRVTPAYIQAMRAAGYNNLSAKEFTTFRIHKITPEFVKAMSDAGYGNLTAKQIKDFGIHKVTPAFISAIRAVGYGNLQAGELVALRIYDVTPDFIRRARNRFGELTVRQIISVKNSGEMDSEREKG